MNTWEYVVGVVLMLCCVGLIGVVLGQEAKGQGLSSVITGTSMMSDESRTRTKEVRQVRTTRILAIAFFVMALLVSVMSVLTK